MESDRIALCDVLKKSVGATNAVAPEKISCSLNEVTGIKRDVRYVADMSYGSGSYLILLL